MLFAKGGLEASVDYVVTRGLICQQEKKKTGPEK